MLTGNKGEWSEVYALFKLLAEGKLFPGDKNINKITSLFFPIIKVIKNESGIDHEYILDGNIVLINDESQTFTVSVGDFKKYADKLFKLIIDSDKTFGDSEIEEFMLSFNSKKLKAKSSVKSDIRVVIHDSRINQSADLGFSIKSELGGSSTLLNAGDTTNFIFEISDYLFSDTEINEINEISTKSKIKDRLNAIMKKGATLTYHDTSKALFKNNLVLIDSLLPNIIADLVYCYYTTKHTSIKSLTEEIQTRNPLDFDLQFLHSFYEYKVKKFLVDVSLGMMPSKVWIGKYDTTGGHLIVKRNGDVLCYHIYNRNQFEDYLFENTRLDTASSSRHGFGTIYKKNDRYYFKLNLQVRF